MTQVYTQFQAAIASASCKPDVSPPVLDNQLPRWDNFRFYISKDSEHWIVVVHFFQILNRFMGIQGQVSTPAHSRQPAGCTAILLFGKLQHVLVRDLQLQQQGLQIRCKLFRFLQLRKMLDYNKDSKHFEFVLQFILLNISRCNLWYCNRFKYSVNTEACNSERAKLFRSEKLRLKGLLSPGLQCIDYFRCFLIGGISCNI